MNTQYNNCAGVAVKSAVNDGTGPHRVYVVIHNKRLRSDATDTRFEGCGRAVRRASAHSP